MLFTADCGAEVLLLLSCAIFLYRGCVVKDANLRTIIISVAHFGQVY